MQNLYNPLEAKNRGIKMAVILHIAIHHYLYFQPQNDEAFVFFLFFEQKSFHLES